MWVVIILKALDHLETESTYNTRHLTLYVRLWTVHRATEGKLAIFEFDNAPYQKVAGGHPIGGKQVVNPSYLIDNMKNPYERREKMFNMLNVVMYEGDKNMPGSMMWV